MLETKLYKEKNDAKCITKACKRVGESILQAKFSQILENAIIDKLSEEFGSNVYHKKYAIRSSATGEDTEQMSAAGQMETFLGISGINEILSAVKQCWASQFSFTAVEYKRCYGQNLNSPMAVVIQEMVSCDVAGVLFTCDPLTGNPTLMSVTSNYGLGESVVSASEEPDTIILKRHANNDISVKSITIGAKTHKIITGEDNGTFMVDVSEAERESCSISSDTALQLGQIGVNLEQYYQGHRDIEWGFYNNNLYIFQSRPITSATTEAVYEIDHEFDSALRVENDFFSVSNVGEVVPKAFSPLGMDVSQKNTGTVLNGGKKGLLVQMRGRTLYFQKGWLIMHGHFMFNVADVFPMRPNEELSTLKKAFLISFFGRVPDCEEMFEVSKARYALTPEPNPLLSFYGTIQSMRSTTKMLQQTVEDFSDYHIEIEKYNSSKELFSQLLQRIADLRRVTLCLMGTSQTSSMWNMIIFTTLGSVHGEYDNTVYSDFANLLKTNDDVESADVPSASQMIAFHISQALEPAAFKKMTTKEALQWLMTSESRAGQEFRKFLKKHGHRCLQEYDIYSQRWRENPELLVKLLQNLSGNVSSNEKSTCCKNFTSNLNISIGFLRKCLFKWILPYCRKGVNNREISKSLIVKCLGEWRKGWMRLAELMVQEGKIPDEDLLFFMTIEDIRNMLKTNSPKIISKANQRRRRYLKVCDYKFPEIMKGVPKPINLAETEVIINENYFSMKGIPVSQGITKGFIRKAVTLEEAVNIKPGEILLTYSTDIGWTPYFPHLSGVGTELGGLMSHGAVISREYGIPCIAGLHGALKNFQTGDYVVLDGNKGILQKLPIPDN